MTAASTQHNRPGLIARLFGTRAPDPVDTLYAAIIEEARGPGWYRDCGVPDSIDGRFEMVAMVLTLVLLRLERAPRGAPVSVRLTERFIDDMDGQMREIGFGDLVVGKQVGGLVAALGGRLSAYRGSIGEDALLRNLWRKGVPESAVRAVALDRIGELAASIEAIPIDDLIGGRLR